MRHVLNAELIGWHRGKKIPRPYRAVLIMPYEGGPSQPMLRIEEQLSDGYWNVTPGQWYLSTLCDALTQPTRMGLLYINLGQDWAISGMAEAIIEATKHLCEGGEKNGTVAEAENSGRGDATMG